MAVTLNKAEEERIASTQWERYVRARDNGHLDYIDRAKKCDAFYVGMQWRQEDLDSLGDRPALTINEILPTVNAVVAEHSARRADVRFKPKKGGKQEVANVLNKVFEHVMTINRYDWQEREVFADGLIMDGRGYFDVRMDFTEHVAGEIKIDVLDPLDVLLDPDAKNQDPRTWNEVFTTKWSTLDDIEIAYGKKCAEKLRFNAENGSTYGNDSIEWRETRFGSDTTGLIGDNNSTLDKQDVRNIRRLRIIERQYYQMARQDYFVDPTTGDRRQVPEGWEDPKAKKFAKKFGLSIVSSMIKRVRWTVTCDRVVLHHDWSPYDHFTVVPFFAYFRRGRPFGMVSNLISPQEQLNKASSQELHIINTTANSGWVIQNGSLSNLKPEDLEEVGAKSGVVIEYNRGFEKPEKILPNSVPVGLDRVSQKAQANIKTISGVNDMMLNGDAKDADINNPLKMVQQNRGTIMAQVPLDNLNKTRHYLAEIVLNLIQTFYSEERVLQVSDDEDPLHPREPLVVNQMTPEGEVVNDLTVGSYDVMITTVPARDTFDDVQFLEAMALRSIGVTIPDDAIVEYSHLARKAELAKRIRQMTGAEQTPEQQQMAQMLEQMQIAKIQKDLEMLDAKILQLRAQAAKAMADAQDVSSVSPQIELQKLESERNTRMAELDLRRQLAELAARSRDTQTDTGAAVKLATTAMATAAKTKQQNDKPAASPSKGAKTP